MSLPPLRVMVDTAVEREFIISRLKIFCHARIKKLIQCEHYQSIHLDKRLKYTCYFNGSEWEKLNNSESLLIKMLIKMHVWKSFTS